MVKNKGYTLIELLIVIAIIGILASIVLVSLSQSRKNARINGAKTSLKSVLPAIMACRYGGGQVLFPPVIDGDICSSGLNGARWPSLSSGYEYSIGTYDSAQCFFQITTASDEIRPGENFLRCSCATQTCE